MEIGCRPPARGSTELILKKNHVDSNSNLFEFALCATKNNIFRTECGKCLLYEIGCRPPARGSTELSVQKLLELEYITLFFSVFD
jgi:hypothetical protein